MVEYARVSTTPSASPNSPTPTTRADSPEYKARWPHRKLRPIHVVLLLLVAIAIGVPLARPATFDILFSQPSQITQASGGVDHIPLTLEARLSHLLAKPAYEQWETELESRYNCPFFTFARNTYFFHDGKDVQWQAVGANDVRRYRSKMVHYLRLVERNGGQLIWHPSMEAMTPPSERRGIIYTGGEGKTLARLRLSLRMLRHVIKSTLPVQLYHFPDELQDPATRTELVDEFAVELIQVGAKRPDGKSWHIKNEAFLATKFTSFVYMDSDNLPLADPAVLFDSVEFQQSGSVFWADLNKDHPDNAIFRIVGRPCSDEHWPAETGQIIFDKRGNNGLNLAVLHLSNHMMQNPDDYGFLSYGDKDTFRFAFYALGLHYQQAPRLFGSAGGYQRQNGDSSPEYFCGHSLIQWGLTPQSAKHDPTYHPLPQFLHTILAKHRYGLQPDKLFSHMRRPRLDGILESRLVRTLYEFTGDCFAISLKGPDGMPDADNSYGDGQGVLTLPMQEVVGDDVWSALKDLSEAFVNINKDV